MDLRRRRGKPPSLGLVFLILWLPTALLVGDFGTGPALVAAGIWATAILVCIVSMFYFRRR
jgi:hypothetical protein